MEDQSRVPVEFTRVSISKYKNMDHNPFVSDT